MYRKGIKQFYFTYILTFLTLKASLNKIYTFAQLLEINLKFLLSILFFQYK